MPTAIRYQKHKEYYKKYDKEYRNKNREKVLERQRKSQLKYYYKNRDKCIAAVKKRQEKNKDKVALYHKSYNLKILYGLTLSDYEELLEKQNGKCAICGCVTKLCVDHNHTTTNTRGLLCRKCNSIIGLANDNILILLNAIKYLEVYNNEENLNNGETT